MKEAFVEGYEAGFNEGYGQALSDWSKGVPQKDGKYLVTLDADGALFVVIGRWNHNGWDSSFPVKAWMPLPEPYGEEDK